MSPPSLLLQQLLQAHYVFLLHHGPSLSDLYVRLPRDKFCNTLERFWTRYARSWDVLLHGNPAVDIFSGVKLSSGGELGFGVGEEEWGSGERDVLEDLTRRTDGMVDLVVSRFGEPAPAREALETLEDRESMPWLGAGNEPLASDGVIFGGVGALSRSSLRSVSMWMRQIYKYGEYAHGVRDNPNRERRKRRKRNPPEHLKAVEPAADDDREGWQAGDADPRQLRQKVQAHETAKRDNPLPDTVLPSDKRPELHDRVASQDYATGESTLPATRRPDVPQPIKSAAEQSLNKASTNADDKPQNRPDAASEALAGTTLGIPDHYMKYLTFGLSTFATRSSPPSSRPTGPRRTSTSSSKTLRPTASDDSTKTVKKNKASSPEDPPSRLAELDPMPEGESIKAKMAMQKHQESKGHFIIGLKGDLDNVPEDEDADLIEGSFHADSEGNRTVLRTLQVEMKSTEVEKPNEERRGYLSRMASDCSGRSKGEGETIHQRLRVLVYVHRPFIYCFLFEQRAPSLSLARFYKDLHRNLVPIHKPLVSSTSVAKVAQRIAASQDTPAEDTASIRSTSSAAQPQKPPIHELLYDPRTLTVHTSVPNIPEPGTPAAEGIATTSSGKIDPPPWTRVDAMNVHSQILSTLATTRRSKKDKERMSKTSRGWWVVWLRLPPSIGDEAQEEAAAAADDDDDDGTASASTAPPERSTSLGTSTASGADTPLRQQRTRHSQWEEEVQRSRIAFLVRKSADAAAAGKTSSGGSSGRSRGLASGMFGTLSALRPGWVDSAEEVTGGVGAGWGPGALAGGMGVDARKYVEGLLSLNR